jgi:cystathionine beta-lyase/cystathionine gamma-synthase
VNDFGDGTRAVRAGLPEPDQGEPLLPGPEFAGPFALRGDPQGADYVYGGYGNPTWTRVEQALGELEGGEAVLFASGMAALRHWRRVSGAIPGPFEAWLLHRALMTLDIRLERQCANALAIAELLAGRDDVTGVRYPGLPADPGHEIAARQMNRYGPLIAFDLGSRERAEAFLEGCELVTEATSFGGVHTTAERRARWGSDDVPEGFIRLSAGCEDAEDLLADLTTALDG